MFARSCSIR
ncbi:hypothetical protein F383_25298 [Gossypium arboreum]|uniref:Uncharacterized protein n=1 Tax=Gossypium arboreum TaxID=29729 RepID=A0A0B0P294_GOSAR|nr:hypothetical protein F383_25298 [Gossypium arboreum]